MKRIYSILLAIVLLVLSAPAISGENDNYIIVFLHDEACPIQITDWTAWYQDEKFIEEIQVNPLARTARLRCKLVVKNSSTNEVTAFKVNTVIFNPFDEYLDTYGIYKSADIEPGKETTREYTGVFNNADESLTFFLWVDKVRDADGNLYFADLQKIKSDIEEKMDMVIPLEYLEPGTTHEINSKSRLRERSHVEK